MWDHLSLFQWYFWAQQSDPDTLPFQPAGDSLEEREGSPQISPIWSRAWATAALGPAPQEANALPRCRFLGLSWAKMLWIYTSHPKASRPQMHPYSSPQMVTIRWVVVLSRDLKEIRIFHSSCYFSQNPYYFRAAVKLRNNHYSYALSPSFYMDLGDALNLFYSIRVPPPFLLLARQWFIW